MKIIGKKIQRFRDTAVLALGAALFMVAAVQLHPAALAASPSTGTVTVTATLSAFADSVVKVGTADTATASVTGITEYNPPISAEDENAVGKSYFWSATVDFSSTADGAYSPAPQGTYTLTLSGGGVGASTVITVTPKVAGYWEVSASCQVNVGQLLAGVFATTVTPAASTTPLDWVGTGTTGTEKFTSYTFDITYTGSVAAASGDTTDSGTVVTGKTTDVHAGWPIQLGAELAPSDLASKFTWTISGAGGNGSAAINGYVVASGGSTARVVALSAAGDTKSAFPDPSNSPAMLQSYYYTESGSFNASVAATAVPGASAKATFTAAAPNATLTTTTSVVCGGADSGMGAGAMDFGDEFLTAADPGSPFPQPAEPGIGFNAVVSDAADFAGNFNFVQMYAPDQDFYSPGGVLVAQAAGAGLDTSFPYGLVASEGGEFQTNDNPGTAPNVGTANGTGPVGSIAIADHATMWCIYKPSVAGSIWVPLDSVLWNWRGVDIGYWQIANTSASKDPAGNRTDIYPTWDGYANRVPVLSK